MVQRLGSGPQSTDKFYSHKVHKQQAMVPKADKDMGFCWKEVVLSGDSAQPSCLTDPKLPRDHPLRMLTLVLQCTQLYSL